MDRPTLPLSTWTTRLSAWAFVGFGILLTFGAVALPAWWLTHPPGAADTPSEAQVPILLPETPSLEDPSQEEAPPRPTPLIPPTATREPAHPPERLVIPEIDLDASVTPVGWTTVQIGGEALGQWQVPGEGKVGWHNTSAGLGQTGNTVLNGHHNLYGEVFRRLVEVEEGDHIWLWAGEEYRIYTVTETVILPEKYEPMEVRLANAERILPTDDERVTLVTCWPYSGNSHRLVVVAKPTLYH